MRKNKALLIFSIFVFAFLFVPLLIIVVTAFEKHQQLHSLLKDLLLSGLRMFLNLKLLLIL